jgi:hypothetical protein
MTASQFPRSVGRAKHPFEKIHLDLKSFSTDSYSRYKYFISFIDDYSSHAWVMLLRKKSDALEAIRNFLAMVKTQYGTTIKEWMSDGGGEYKSDELDRTFKENGIKILGSVPHQPQQNGRAERFNRTIVEKAQALRFDACLPESWWEFSVTHAVHLYNRTPIKRLQWRTPYELLKGEQPDVGHLKVFGCGAYVYLPEDVRANKLAPRSELMIFLGYPDGMKGYLFMRTHNNTLFKAAKAVFDETLFPKCPDAKAPRGSTQTGEPPSSSETPSNGGDNIPFEGSDDDGDFPRHPSSPKLPRRDQGLDGDGPHDQDPPQAPPGNPDPQDAEQPQPRRSGRLRDAPSKPGNSYTGKPTDTLKQKESEWKKTVGDTEKRPRGYHKSRQQKDKVPGPSTAPPPPAPSDTPALPEDAETEMAKLAREGGVEFIQYLLAKAVSDKSNEPLQSTPREWTFRDIQRMPDAQRKEWFAACKEEIEALQQRGVIELVELPHGRKTVKCRWVFDVKSDGRKRARLVAKGFSQVEGIDYDAIFSPVVRFESVRTMLAVAALEDWYVTALDVKSAFLYGKLDEEIYMEQPEGFKVPGKEHMVLRLRRAIYGLKQAAHAWYKELVKSMELLHFKRLSTDTGIFIFHTADSGFVIMIAYVDDILFMGPNRKLVDKKKGEFMAKWECRDLGEPKEFLRMHIIRRNGKIYLDQSAYLEKVLQRFGMADCHSARTPMPEGWRPEPNPDPVDDKLRQLFQSVIGSLLYLMLGTRPDIAYAVTKLSQFAANPSKEHLNKALYICKYLRGTSHYALVLDGPSKQGLIAYSDSDHAGDHINRRSITGYIVKLANATISWTSHAQKTVATSSTEAEYMALSDCSRQAMWLKHLFSELGIPIRKIPICTDNNGAIFIRSNPIQERRVKHIDVRYHYIRERVESGDVEILRVDSNDNPADMFTKPLGYVKFEQFRSMLGLEFYSD